MSDINFPNSKLLKTEAERKRSMRENETPGERALLLENNEGGKDLRDWRSLT